MMSTRMTSTKVFEKSGFRGRHGKCGEKEGWRIKGISRAVRIYGFTRLLASRRLL